MLPEVTAMQSLDCCVNVLRRWGIVSKKKIQYDESFSELQY